MPPDPASLRTDALSRPETSEPFLRGDCSTVVDWYAQPSGQSRRLSRVRVNKRDLYRLMGIEAGAALRLALRNLATVPPEATAAQRLQAEVYAEVIDLLDDLGPEGGIDVTLDESRQFIDQLAGAGLVSPAQAQLIKSQGDAPATRGDSLLGGAVTLDAVRAARKAVP